MERFLPISIMQAYKDGRHDEAMRIYGAPQGMIDDFVRGRVLFKRKPLDSDFFQKFADNWAGIQTALTPTKVSDAAFWHERTKVYFGDTAWRAAPEGADVTAAIGLARVGDFGPFEALAVVSPFQSMSAAVGERVNALDEPSGAPRGKITVNLAGFVQHAAAPGRAGALRTVQTLDGRLRFPGKLSDPGAVRAVGLEIDSARVWIDSRFSVIADDLDEALECTIFRLRKAFEVLKQYIVSDK